MQRASSSEAVLHHKALHRQLGHIHRNQPQHDILSYAVFESSVKHLKLRPNIIVQRRLPKYGGIVTDPDVRPRRLLEVICSNRQPQLTVLDVDAIHS